MHSWGGHPLVHTHHGFLLPRTPTHTNSSRACPTAHTPCPQAPPKSPHPSRARCSGLAGGSAQPGTASPHGTGMPRAALGSPRLPATLSVYPDVGSPCPLRCISAGHRSHIPHQMAGTQPSAARPDLRQRPLAGTGGFMALLNGCRSMPSFIYFWGYKGELTQLRLCNRSPLLPGAGRRGRAGDSGTPGHGAHPSPCPGAPEGKGVALFSYFLWPVNLFGGPRR